MATKAWFDYATYMGNKLVQMQSLEPNEGWNATKLKAAFEKAGFVGDEGAQAHFLKYGANEDVSPNQLFDADYYYKAKAIQYYTSEAGGSHTEDEVRANIAKYALDVEGLIRKAGMNAWSHYTKYGTAEGINPSDGFNTEAYMEAKLEAMGTGWTMESLNAAFKKAGINALAHAMQYGGDATNTASGEVTVWSDVAHTTLLDEFNSNDDNIGVTGAAYTLTTAIETVNGDTNATVTGIWNNDGQLVTTSTFNAGDTINTAKDVNLTLTAVQVKTDDEGNIIQLDAPVVALNNVTNFNVKALTNNPFGVDGASFTNVSNINVDSSTVPANLVLTNIELASTIGINSSATSNGIINAVDLTYRASQVSGDSDIANFAANNGVGAVTINSNVETVSYAGAGTNTVTFIDNSPADTAKTFVVSGSGTNTLNVGGLDNVTKWDMSASTGTNTLDVAGVLDDKGVVAGGSGQDTLVVATADAVKNIEMSGVETLALDNSNGEGTLVFKTATGLTGVQVNGVANGDGVQAQGYSLDGLTAPKTLNYVGAGDKNNTDLAQYFNKVAFDASFTGSADALAISVNNDGVALDKGVGYTMGNLNLKGVETATINVADVTNEADAAFGTITAANLTGLQVSTDNGSVTIEGLTTSTGRTLATLDFSGVKGTDHASTVAITGDNNFAANATITAGDGGLEVTAAANIGKDDNTDKLTFKGGDGEDKLDVSTSQAAVTFTGGAGDDKFVSGEYKSTVTGGAGNDDITINSATTTIIYNEEGQGGKALKASADKAFDGGDTVTGIENSTESFKINANKIFTSAGTASSDADSIDTLEHTADIFIAAEEVAANITAKMLAQTIDTVNMGAGDVAWYVASNGETWNIYEIVAGSKHEGTVLDSSDTISLIGTFDAALTAESFSTTAL